MSIPNISDAATALAKLNPTPYGNIESLVSTVSDYARPNKYFALINSPSNITSFPANIASALDTGAVSMACQACSIPGMTIETEESRTGAPIKTQSPYNVVYEPLECTFQVSTLWNERQFFEDWMDKIYDKKTRSFSYYKDYIGSIVITQLDRARLPIASYTFNEVYPAIISPIELSYETNDTIETFSVTFNYKDWQTKDFGLLNLTKSATNAIPNFL